MRYLKIAGILLSLIVVFAACYPAQSEEFSGTEVSSTPRSSIVEQPIKQLTPTQLVTMIATIELTETKLPVTPTVQESLPNPTLTKTPHIENTSTPTPTIEITETPVNIEGMPPSAITYMSQCEVWTKDTDGTATQMTDTGEQILEYSFHESTATLAYLIEKGEARNVYLKRSAEQVPELIFESDWESNMVFDLGFSPDGTLLAITTYSGVWLFNVNTGELDSIYEGPWPSNIMAYQSPMFSPQNKWLLLDIQHMETRKESVLNLETGEKFDFPGALEWGYFQNTINWANEDAIDRYVFESDSTGTYTDYEIGTYMIPDLQIMDVYALGTSNFVDRDEEWLKDFVITREDEQGQISLETKWDSDVTGASDDKYIYLLATSYDEEKTIYTTLLQWERGTESWQLLFREPTLSQGQRLYMQLQTDGSPIFYVDTEKGIFHLNLQTQTSELVANAASFHDTRLYSRRWDWSCP